MARPGPFSPENPWFGPLLVAVLLVLWHVLT